MRCPKTPQVLDFFCDALKDILLKNITIRVPFPGFGWDGSP
jgi:hypothetical protein